MRAHAGRFARAVSKLLAPAAGALTAEQAQAIAEEHFAAIGWSGRGALKMHRTVGRWRVTRQLAGRCGPSATVEIGADTGAALAMQFDAPPATTRD